MYLHVQRTLLQPQACVLSVFCALLLMLAGCGGSTTPTSPTTAVPAAKQILTFPNVGTTDLSTLDPALASDANSQLAITMLYSGLVRADKTLQVIPDQATWQVSDDLKIYTFHLQPNIKFSDGTPVTAQTYVYSWTRALLPEVGSSIALFYEQPIEGATEVNSGKTQTLAGLKALNDQTLQVTLTQPTPYFLSLLTKPLFFPVNQKLIARYGEKNWAQNVVGNGVGTGPLLVRQWDHNVKMIFGPNPYYYGKKTRLTMVSMYFVNDPGIAYETYRASQSDFIWGLTQADQQPASEARGFIRTPLLQTDALFFDTTTPPFNNLAMRQAFAYALDKADLAHNFFKDTVMPANTIIPPGMPGYQVGYAGLSLDKKKARTLLKSVYPDLNTIPPITFSYPSSLVTGLEAGALAQMWKTVLGVTVKLRAVEPTAYDDEMDRHLIQMGFVQWSADFPDPYDCLAPNLLSTAEGNAGQWSNQAFDQTIAAAEQNQGDRRLALYNKAEQIAISDVAWLPLDHQMLAAIIPSWVHGVTLNGSGLYFADWSDVYMLAH